MCLSFTRARLLILLPFLPLPVSPLKLSISSLRPSPNPEHVTITTSWMHEEQDPPSGGSSFELSVIDSTSTLGSGRVVSSFPIPSDDSGSFVSVLTLSAQESTISARAVDSKHNVFAMSNTISFDHTPGTDNDTADSGSGSSVTSTSTSSSPSHHETFPSTATATKLQDQSGNSFPPPPPPTQTAVGASTVTRQTSSSSNTSLATILGVTIPIVVLFLSVCFICTLRYWSRKNRDRERKRRSFDVDFSAKVMVVSSGSSSTTAGGRLDSKLEVVENGHGIRTLDRMEDVNKSHGGWYGHKPDSTVTGIGREIGIPHGMMAEGMEGGPAIGGGVVGGGGSNATTTVGHGRKKSKVSFVIPPPTSGKPRPRSNHARSEVPFQVPAPDRHIHQEGGITSTPSTGVFPERKREDGGNLLLPYSPSEPLLPPPPLTPNYLKRMTPDVPLDLDDQGRSLRVGSFGGVSFDSRI